MLNFIVLGYIPGTTVQLNFIDVLLFAGLLLSIFGGISYLRSRTRKQVIKQLSLSLISL